MKPIGPLINRWEADLYARTSKMYARIMTWMVRRFCREEGIAYLEQFTEAKISDYWLHLRLRGLSGATIYLYLGRIRAFGNYLLRCGEIVANPVGRLPLRQPPPPAIVCYNDLEISEIFSVAREVKLWPFVALCYYLGLRANEARLLYWEDVDLAGRMVTVRHGKGGKQRRVPIPNALAEILRPLRQDAGPVVPAARDRQRPASLCLLYQRGARLKRALPHIFRQRTTGGAGSLFHGLRSTYATRVARVCPIRNVQAWLGHSHLQTTERYLKAAEEYDERIEEAF